MYSKTCLVVSGEWDHWGGDSGVLEGLWGVSERFAQKSCWGLSWGEIGIAVVPLGTNLSSTPLWRSMQAWCLCGYPLLLGTGGLAHCKREETSPMSIRDGVELGKVPVEIDWL